ncbi:F-box protein At5g07610-like [Cornus florida]|uniref:F-box protein At5g07610-like n=1 Tax=Cornus florida TaxID=4283 RepID=UPI00289D6B47|nr:F-box protein At5g07610-like [Cornus florida]
MASNIQRRPNASDHITAASEIIGGNEELVVEILQRLPAKSLIRLKSVSKTWLSLISSRRFSLLLWQQQNRRRRHPKISGLFCSCGYVGEIDYIPTMDSENKKSLTQFPDFSSGESGEWHTKIIDSCSGLLLICCLCLAKPGYDSYHVYNPTTKQFSTLPRPFPQSCLTRSLNLAFDPLKSLHYKVVLLQSQNKVETSLYIYSSETNAWSSPFADPFSELDRDVDGVYCNGSIHWISLRPNEASFYFDVDKEILCPMPSPQCPGRCMHQHFGESRGHLHFLSYHPNAGFKVSVSEMERDYSKWSLKYRVNLEVMVDFVSRDMIVQGALSVISLIHGEYGDCLAFHGEKKKEKKDLFLLLFLGANMIISYNIKDNTFKKLHDVVPGPHSNADELLGLLSCHVHPYIETLFPV